MATTAEGVQMIEQLERIRSEDARKYRASCSARRGQPAKSPTSCAAAAVPTRAVAFSPPLTRRPESCIRAVSIRV
jgi:hypothetical protein